MVIQIALFVVCLSLFFYTLILVSKKRLLLKYSLLWLALSAVLGFCALFPAPIYYLSKLVGFETPSNFLFVLAIIFLLLITLSLSVIASRQTAYIKSLVQELAILKAQLEQE